MNSELNVNFHRRAYRQREKQEKVPWIEKDFSYIEDFRNAYENETGDNKDLYLYMLREAEVHRYYFTGSLWQINHLIQFDSKPNLELRAPKLEIYKISLSFTSMTLRKILNDTELQISKSF